MRLKSRLGESKIIGMLFVGIIVGGVIGLTASYLVFSPRINQFKNELSEVESKYFTLSVQYDTISREHDTLKAENDELQSQYSILSSDHKKLQSDYNIISNDYSKSSKYLRELSSDVQNIIEVLNSYINITESFDRVLNKEELEMIDSHVRSITKESEDNWYSYERIYKHFSFNIDDFPDIEFPYIADYQREMIEEDVITGFTVNTTTNYVQTPIFTLRQKQGDVEDQVVTAYAMIKYYEKNIYETEYILYIAEIQFSDGSSHLAIFIPVEGGRTRTKGLCIIDPAAKYYTNKFGEITNKFVPNELASYSKFWSKTAGEITYLKLYDVDVGDGSYIVAAKGTLNEIEEFLTTE